jgi:hypothetical protein
MRGFSGDVDEINGHCRNEVVAKGISRPSAAAAKHLGVAFWQWQIAERVWRAVLRFCVGRNTARRFE